MKSVSAQVESKMRACTLFILLLLTVGMVGCSKAEKDWKAAENARVIERYRAFLTEHPDSAHATEARDRIRLLTWDQAHTSKDLEAIERYIKDYPAAANRADAEKELDDLSWRKASAQATLDSIEAYTRRFTNGSHLREANVQLDELRWSAAKKGHKERDYALYIERYGKSGAHAEEARVALDEALVVGDFENINEKIKIFLNGSGAINTIHKICDRKYGQEQLIGGPFRVDPGTGISVSLKTGATVLIEVTGILGGSNLLDSVTKVDVKEGATIDFSNGRRYAFNAGKWSKSN